MLIMGAGKLLQHADSHIIGTGVIVVVGRFSGLRQWQRHLPVVNHVLFQAIAGALLVVSEVELTRELICIQWLKVTTRNKRITHSSSTLITGAEHHCIGLHSLS